MSRFAPAQRLRRLAPGAMRLSDRAAPLLACLISLAVTFGAAAAEYTFDLPQARQIALQAALTGNNRVALSLADKLLHLNPNDSAAHLVVATVQLGNTNWDAAYKTSRRAFRFAESDVDKYQAARLSAVAAMGDERVLATQFWLRRAGDLAPNIVERRRVERQYRILQSENPWRYRFDLSVTPSSNVNGGSETPYNIIDGVPLVGYLSPDAQALSGWVGQTNITASYRLRRTDRSQTSLTSALYIKRAALSDEAKRFAPNYDAGALSQTSFSLGLSHTIALAQPGALLTFSGGLRQAWQAQSPSYLATNANIAYRRPLGKNLTFSGNLGVETRDYQAGGTGQTNSANLGLSYRFGNGNTLSAAVQASEATTQNPVFDNWSTLGKVSYALAKPIKTVRISTSLGIGLTDYQNYQLGFIPVPGGRQDEATFIDLDATFTGLEFAGFSPSLRLRRQRTTSNVSRFTTSEWAVSAGIETNF